MPSVPDIALATASSRTLFDAISPVVALVSGGADSTALLCLLASGDLGATGPVSVLHVNHLLRGEESDADAAFVTQLAADANVPCHVVRFDVAAYAEENGLNLEDAGRRVRYRFAEETLDAACEAADVPHASGRIAVAHNRDDRAETFLMRAIQGAGARGLSAIRHRRGRIVRPLLDCDRAAIREWLTQIPQAWREDSSNDDTTRLRALVRAEIVPVAERVNPSFRETLARSLDLLGDEEALLAGMADGFAAAFAHMSQEGRLEFDRSAMRSLDRVMARRTIRTALMRAFPEASRLEAAHVEALVNGLGETGFARDLPGGLRAASEYTTLAVYRGDLEAVPVAPSLLPLPGTAKLGLLGRIVAEKVGHYEVAGSQDSVTIDAGESDVLVVDAVRPGDRMRPFGMAGSRKVSDILVDMKVPRRTRQSIPVVRDQERIVWLAGLKLSDEYRVTDKTTRAMRLTWEHEE